MHQLSNRYRQGEHCRVPPSKQHVSQDTEMDLKLTEYKKLLAKRVYLLSYIDIFYKRCIVLDETTVHN